MAPKNKKVADQAAPATAVDQNKKKNKKAGPLPTEPTKTEPCESDGPLQPSAAASLRASLPDAVAEPLRASSPDAKSSPAKKARHSGGGDESKARALPRLPARTQLDVNVVDTMNDVMRHVGSALRQHLRDDIMLASAFADKDLHEHAPLNIKSESTTSELRSYKAPWSADSAEMSLKSTGMYEASGNLFWTNPFPTNQHAQRCAGEVPDWASVCAMADTFKYIDDQTEEGKDQEGRIRRIIFPVTLCVHASSLCDLTRVTFAGTIDIVTGHAASYGWHVAMYNALQSKDSLMVASLWQCALTVTLQAHLLHSPAALAVLSMRQNSVMARSARTLADTFPTFARKLDIALKPLRADIGSKERIEYCKQHNISYNGSSVSPTMLTSALAYNQRIDEPTHSLLMTLERTVGKDVLTTKYNNLYCIIKACQREIEVAPPARWNSATCADLVSHICHFIIWGCKHGAIQPGCVTVEFLDKTRSGSPGCCHKVLAKVMLVAYLRTLSTSLPESSKARASCLTVLECFASYGTYRNSFTGTDDDVTMHEDGDAPDASLLGDAGNPVKLEVGDDDATDDDDQGQDKDPFQQMKERCCKTGQLLLDFLFDIFGCDYDADITELLKEHTGSIASLEWKNFKGKGGDRLRDVEEQLARHKQVVSLLDGAPPLASTSSVADGADAPDVEQDMKARQDAWKSVQAVRKKYATVSVGKFNTSADLQRWFEKQRPAFQFKGKPGESHRVFVASADTFGDECGQPWESLSNKSEDFGELVKFMASQTGAADLLLCFDGRNVADRKVIEPLMESTRNSGDLWILYKPMARLGGKGSVWSSNLKEVCWISFPVSRTSSKADDKNSTRDEDDWMTGGSYCGVEAVPWKSLPLLPVADKATIMGGEPAVPPTTVFDADLMGMPLYWQESKPISLWEDVFSTVGAQFVVDLSPGSGAAGRAAMRLGISYLGLCRGDRHALWLANVFDRVACHLIADAKAPLFDKDLASSINTHFDDVLKHMAKMTDDTVSDSDQD